MMEGDAAKLRTLHVPLKLLAKLPAAIATAESEDGGDIHRSRVELEVVRLGPHGVLGGRRERFGEWTAWSVREMFPDCWQG